MNLRDLLIRESNHSFEKLLELTYRNLCSSEIDDSLLDLDELSDIDIGIEEKKEILKYIEDLDLSFEEKEIFDQYTDLELAELGILHDI